MKNKYILFDFDGVIMDTFQIGFETQKKMCPDITVAGYKSMFDGNIFHSIDNHSIHNKNCDHDFDYEKHYVPRMKKQAKMFKGIDGVIKKLSKEYTLLVISSSVSDPIGEVLVKNNIAQCFDWIMGRDIHKSKTEKIQMVFEKYRCKASDCVFITDTLGDMIEAKKKDVKSIAVSWGFQSKGTLGKGAPYSISEKPKELIEDVKLFFSK